LALTWNGNGLCLMCLLHKGSQEVIWHLCFMETLPGCLLTSPLDEGLQPAVAGSERLQQAPLALPWGQNAWAGLCALEAKNRKRKHYAFRRQFKEKPSIIPGCPPVEGMVILARPSCSQPLLCCASRTCDRWSCANRIFDKVVLCKSHV